MYLGINYIPFDTETPVQSFQNFEPIAKPIIAYVTCVAIVVSFRDASSI